MFSELISILVNLLTLLLLVLGLFFMLVGAVGVVRLPDFYARSSAASKCVTLGTAGLLISLVVYLAVSVEMGKAEAKQEVMRELQAEVGEEMDIPAATTKALLVIVFIFVASPVGSHMLARAAHLARVRMWRHTISDELAEDRGEAMSLDLGEPQAADSAGVLPDDPTETDSSNGSDAPPKDMPTA
ncbi:MAG: monovalent cation/H(+) antiporter subunit G [Planctomycetota bacterium]